MVYGYCIDELLKFHAAYDYPVWMYSFDHRSEFEPLPYWMGRFKQVHNLHLHLTVYKVTLSFSKCV